MSIDIWDHDGNALAIYREAGADPSEPPGPHGLARMLGITIRYDCRTMLGGAEHVRNGDREYIFLRARLTPLVEGVRIYHEIAERHLRRAIGEEDIERAADELAYHLRMPRAAFRALVVDVGCDLVALAEPWPATQTASALRYVEVEDTPGVVVTPREVRVRGPAWQWPDESELRRIAHARTLPDGVNRVPITDRAGAVLLLAS